MTLSYLAEMEEEAAMQENSMLQVIAVEIIAMVYSKMCLTYVK